MTKINNDIKHKHTVYHIKNKADKKLKIKNINKCQIYNTHLIILNMQTKYTEYGLRFLISLQ